MRIRKNANLSSLIFSHASGTEPLQSHVCQLNQSPWDVIPFSQETTSPSPLHQLEGEDSFNGNGSLGDSIGAVESNSFPSLMEDSGEEKVDKMVIDDNDDNYKMEDEDEEDELEEEEMKIGYSCKNKKKLGRPLKSYSNNSKKSVASSGRRGRGKAARRGGATTSNSAANPYEFYYYSGFGPLWGKRRGGGGRGREIMNNNNNKSAEIDGVSHDTTTSSSVDHFEELDFLDDEDSDDDDDDDNDNDPRELGGKKKRMRKPVKARSLKSLM